MSTDSTTDPMSSLGDAELLDVLRDTEIERRRLYAKQLRAISEIDTRGIPNTQGNTVDTVALVQEILNLSPHEIRRMAAHAGLLNETVAPSGARIGAKLPVVSEALSEGTIAPEHVEVIRKAVTTLPDNASVEDRVVAEKILCEAAASCEPHYVKRLGQEIHLRLNPDGDEPKDTKLRNPLRRLDIQERKDGGVSGSFDLDAENGALLTNLLSPLTAPTPGPEGRDERSPSERRGDAFAQILKAAANCPDASTEAGEPVTVMVSVSLEDLKTGVGRGLIDGHTNLSAAQIRRMACDSKILPTVLGSKSEPLDIGRATRVVPRSIRRSLIHRDRGCTFPSCTKRAKWTHAHHVRHWATGGPTSLENLALLCHHHHRLIHHGDWEIRMRQGYPWFVPPSYVDPQRTPRRNVLHTTRGRPHSANAKRAGPAWANPHRNPWDNCAYGRSSANHTSNSANDHASGRVERARSIHTPSSGPPTAAQPEYRGPIVPGRSREREQQDSRACHLVADPGQQRPKGTANAL